MSKKARTGNPGHFSGERLKYLEDSLPRYLAFELKSKAKADFLRDFMPDFLDLFPVEQYPLPPRRETQLEEKTEVEIQAMNTKQRKLYKQAAARRDRPDSNRLRDVGTVIFFL